MTTATLLTMPQAAKFLNVSPRTIWELKKAGKLKYIPVGKRLIRFDPQDLLAFIEENKKCNDAESGEN